MLGRGEMQHLPVGLAGGFWREAASIPCPFPKLEKGGISLKSCLVG